MTMQSVVRLFFILLGGSLILVIVREIVKFQAAKAKLFQDSVKLREQEIEQLVKSLNDSDLIDRVNGELKSSDNPNQPSQPSDVTKVK